MAAPKKKKAKKKAAKKKVAKRKVHAPAKKGSIPRKDIKKAVKQAKRGRQGEGGGAPKKNQFWLMRSKHGRDKIFESEEILWNAACEYFQWVTDNPLQEEKLFNYQGKIKKGKINKMRAMTIEGLCLFLDIVRSTWDNYRNNDGFLNITSKIENVIRNQKFSGAAADLLNANIIARDLGLKDSAEITGPDNGPIQTMVTFVGRKPKKS